MKLKSIHLLSTVLAAAFSMQQAQSAPPAGQELAPIVVQGQRTAIPKITGEKDTPVATFGELIDLPVYNYQNEKLGHIKAITVDLEHARVVEVLVSSGSGIMGMNGKITPVPPTAFKVDARHHEAAWLNVSKARFDAAPPLGRSNAATYSQADRVAAGSRYFGVKPWFGQGGLGYVQTTADIDLMQIKNPQGKYMGKVGLIMMDLPTGRVRQIVNDMETMHGDGSHVLAPSALRYNVAHNGLVLNSTYASLNDSPHFRWVRGNGGDTHYMEQTNAGQQTFVTNRITTPSRVKRPAHTRQIAAE
jgi:sporulation protein YlmC with PRC-barrel domain